jgi:hypothetical protein
MRRTTTLLGLSILCLPAAAGDWGNLRGGWRNAARGLDAGPTAATVLWAGAGNASIGSEALLLGSRALLNRTDVASTANSGLIECRDIATGSLLWFLSDIEIYTTLVAVSPTTLYAATQSTLTSLDVQTGAINWVINPNQAPTYGVIASNGDLILDGDLYIRRYDPAGNKLWSHSHGVFDSQTTLALYADRLYTAESQNKNLFVRRIDPTTGLVMYSSAALPTGAAASVNVESSELAVDLLGRIYVQWNRGNTIASTTFYALDDTGTGFTTAWTAAGKANTFALTADGGVVHVGPAKTVERLSSTGAVVANSVATFDALDWIVTDPLGRAYCAGGSEVRAYDAGMALMWSDSPGTIDDLCLGQNGALVASVTGMNVTAYGTPQSLTADISNISLATGGTQHLSLDAGLAQGGKLWLLAGSASGTQPGVPLGSFVLPLNIDPYALFTLTAPGVVLVPSFGFTDAMGKATSSFVIPGGLSSSPLPVDLHHAFLVVTLEPTNAFVSFTSNPVPVTLWP